MPDLKELGRRYATAVENFAGKNPEETKFIEENKERVSPEYYPQLWKEPFLDLFEAFERNIKADPILAFTFFEMLVLAADQLGTSNEIDVMKRILFR